LKSLPIYCFGSGKIFRFPGFSGLREAKISPAPVSWLLTRQGANLEARKPGMEGKTGERQGGASLSWLSGWFTTQRGIMVKTEDHDENSPTIHHWEPGVQSIQIVPKREKSLHRPLRDFPLSHWEPSAEALGYSHHDTPQRCQQSG